MNQLSPTVRRYALLLVLAMVAVTVSGAFAIVWMQQQITRTAERGSRLEEDLAETVRKLDYLDERIATIHRPVVLQGKVAGRLEPLKEEHVVWVRERETAGGRAYAVARPYETSVDLAFADLRTEGR